MPLFSGGSIYKVLPLDRDAHKTRKQFYLRLVLIWCIGWVPLLFLSILFDNEVKSQTIPFYLDFPIHIRFLIVAPIFVFADVLAESGLGRIVGHFWTGRLISRNDTPKFRACIQNARKLARSRIPDLANAILVATLVIIGARKQLPLDVSNWMISDASGKPMVSPAGLWLNYISTPIYQFLVLNWIWRFGIWSYLLARIAHLDLLPNPLHPDRAGGLGFVGQYTLVFSPFIIAFGLSYSSVMGMQIIYQGVTLTSLLPEIGVYLGLTLVFITAPSFFFSAKMSRSRTQGILTSSNLAGSYVKMFDKKWMKKTSFSDTRLLGSEDIQSLNALQGSFDTIKEMRVNPLDIFAILTVMVAAILPMLPLVFTIYSPKDLFKIIVDTLL